MPFSQGFFLAGVCLGYFQTLPSIRIRRISALPGAGNKKTIKGLTLRFVDGLGQALPCSANFSIYCQAVNFGGYRLFLGVEVCCGEGDGAPPPPGRWRAQGPDSGEDWKTPWLQRSV